MNVIKNQHKIVIIGVYFGKLPSCIDLFLKSCSVNLDIDFLFITDQDITSNIANIKFIKMTFENLKQMINDKLSITATIDKPYKLCDFKPTWGEVFEQYVVGYDFWGHCDFDMMFGDIRSFITPHMLSSFDKILYWGHLTLYRNNKECNKRYRLDGGQVSYLEAFTNQHIYCFDEKPGIYSIYKKHGFKMYEEIIYADISLIWKRLKLAMSDKNHTHQVFFWENGKVFRGYLRDGEILFDEYIYIHFKKRKYDNLGIDIDNDCAFFITPDGIVKKKEGELSEKDIYSNNPYRGYLYELWELFVHIYKMTVFRIKRRLFKLSSSF